MRTIEINSMKVTSSLPLAEISSYVTSQTPLSWKEYIVLDSVHLSVFFKYTVNFKKAYLFSFGCISFINFTQDEIVKFLQNLKSIVPSIDIAMAFTYSESLILKIDQFGLCKFWEGDTGEGLEYNDLIPTASAMVIAKSNALYRLEVAVNNLLDEAEKFILLLEKGKLSIHIRKYASIYGKILRFEHEMAGNVRLFERSPAIEGNEIARKAYDKLAVYYELFDRFDVVESKIQNLRNMTNSYSSLSYNYRENKLLFFEIFLLSLFPLTSLSHLLGKIGLKQFIKLFKFINC